jgi:chromosome segregation ATPase
MKRKKTDTVQLSKIRMREELRQKLARDAERGAKTLNSEIVDRLERSYAADERIEELRERLADMRQSLEESRGEIRLTQEGSKADLAAMQQEATALRQKTTGEIKRIEGELKQIEAAAAVVDALLGDDVAGKKAIRAIALLLANSPGWAGSADSIQKITRGIGAAIETAAEEAK